MVTKRSSSRGRGRGRDQRVCLSSGSRRCRERTKRDRGRVYIDWGVSSSSKWIVGRGEKVSVHIRDRSPPPSKLQREPVLLFFLSCTLPPFPYPPSILGVLTIVTLSRSRSDGVRRDKSEGGYGLDGL